MEQEDKYNRGIRLLDAVEALSAIVEAPSDSFGEDQRSAEEGDWKNISWLKNGNKAEVVSDIKEIFTVILKHLKSCYQEKNVNEHLKDIEGIKSIMLIVGEAAKKIDRYTDLFHTKHLHSVTETREYKQLQEFYNKRISKTIDEAVLSKWIFALSRRAFKESDLAILEEKRLDTKHVFVDLDSVKNDTEYELFFLRKENGTRFFSPRLIRNITLICDFGFQLGQERGRDPLVDLGIWQDRFGFGVAENILTNTKQVVSHNYPLIIHHKDMPLCASIHKAILALHLAASQEKLLSSGSTKGCLSYLADFQMYLRQALKSRAYQHMIAFPNQEFRSEELAAKKIIDELLKQIFDGKVINERLHAYFCYLVNESKETLSQEHKKAVNLDNPVWNQLACDYAALQKFLRNHPNGPLNKVLLLLEEGNYHTFDPFMQQRFPEKLFSLDMDKNHIFIHQMASPTIQELINQADIMQEWLGYIHARKDVSGSIVLLNFQDNTSWREHARAIALEKLQDATEFKGKLHVVTLPKDTEFYYQEMPYEEDNQLIDFKNHLMEHLLGADAGFYFPEEIKAHLTKDWFDGVFSAISRLFFSGKNVLAKDSRMAFIEIFYALLELKVLEILHPGDLYFTCKDGVDVSPTAACVFYALLKLMNGEQITVEEMNHLTEMIYRPALLSRERLLLSKRAERMLGAIKVIENAVREVGASFKARIQNELGPYISLDVKAIE